MADFSSNALLLSSGTTVGIGTTLAYGGATDPSQGITNGLTSLTTSAVPPFTEDNIAITPLITTTLNGTSVSALSINTFTATVTHSGGTTPDVTMHVVTYSDGSQVMLLAGPGTYSDVTGVTVTADVADATSLAPSDLSSLAVGVDADGSVDGTSGSDSLASGYTDLDGDTLDNTGNTINALAGDDTVFAGTGNDTIDAGVGDDMIFGGAGDDIILGNDGADSLWGDAGADTLEGNLGNDKLIGGGGADVLRGDEGDDSLYGDNFAGDLGGQSPTDAPEADFGNDTLQLNGGNDLAYGGSGDDTFEVYDGFLRHEMIGGETGESDGDRIDGSRITTSTTTVLTADETGTIRDNSVADGSATMSFREIEQIDLGSGTDRVEVTTSNTMRVNGADGIDTLDLSSVTPPSGPAPVVTVTSETPYPGVPGVTTKTGFVVFPDGSRMDFENFEEIICFTPGTLIDTDKGLVKVEDLAPGDKVLTRDNGYQPLSWIGRRDLSAEEMRRCSAAAPIRIAAGALGHNVPNRDIAVSPRHRMLVQGARAELMFGEAEVLIAAQDLLGLPGVSQDAPKATSYFHVMCDSHQIIRAEGSWTESFQPSDVVLNALDSETRTELLGLFPELANAQGQAKFMSARPVLNTAEARILFAA